MPSTQDQNSLISAPKWNPEEKLLADFPQFEGGTIGAHPATLSGIVRDIDPAQHHAARSAFETAVAASATLYKQTAILADAKSVLSGADVKHPGGSAQRWNAEVDKYSAHASKALGAAQRAAEQADESLAKTSLDLQTKIKTTLQIPLPAHVQTEVRQYLASKATATKPTGARDYLYQLVGSKDLAALSAAMQAPSYLSGLSDEDLDTAAEMGAQRHAPDLVAQRDAVANLRKALANRLDIVADLHRQGANYAKPIASNRPQGYSDEPRAKKAR